MDYQVALIIMCVIITVAVFIIGVIFGTRATESRWKENADTGDRMIGDYKVVSYDFWYKQRKHTHKNKLRGKRRNR